MSKRAESLDATRERIVEATAALHYEQGVAATSYVHIAERAGVGPATVYRHFPTLGSLVEACGAQCLGGDPAAAARERGRPSLPASTRGGSAWNVSSPSSMRSTTAAPCCWHAARDRDRVPELDAFLRQREAGVEALVREAIGPGAPRVRRFGSPSALAAFPVWLSLKRLGAPPAEFGAPDGSPAGLRDRGSPRRARAVRTSRAGDTAS